MNIPALGPQPLRPLLAQASQTPPPAAPADGAPGDRVTLSSARKNYRALAWTGFGVQCLGAGMVFAHQGALGVAVFAAGALMIGIGETMARKS